MKLVRLPGVLPNEYGCDEQMHRFKLPVCCPVSKNPRPGSIIEIRYEPGLYKLEVAALYAYLHQYQGGLIDEDGNYIVRGMEEMVAMIAQHCANAIGVPVEVFAQLNIAPKQEIEARVTKTPQEI